MNQESTRTQEWTRNEPGVHQDWWGSVKCCSRATDHELALVHAAKYESSNVVTSDNLIYTLRKLGIQVDRNRPLERSESTK